MATPRLILLLLPVAAAGGGVAAAAVAAAVAAAAAASADAYRMSIHLHVFSSILDSTSSFRLSFVSDP